MPPLELMLPKSEGERLTPADQRLVPLAVPHYPSMVDMSVRLESFKHPLFSCVKSAEELAHAGYFFISDYPSYRDMVRCHYCSRNLHCWEEEDDPLGYHVEIHPDCMYARSLKPSKATQRMRNRWAKTSMCKKLLARGLNRLFLDQAFNHIFECNMAFPSNGADLLRIVALVVSVPDCVADDDSLRCQKCRNQAIVLFDPCCHVVSCVTCSNQLTCCQCGTVVVRRFIARLY